MALELPELLLPDADSWRSWLVEHHDDRPGVWLVLHKRGGAVTELTYDQALDEALCFGWIDGQLGRRDAGSYRQRFTPRRPRSPWSARNVSHVERLSAAGAMTPAGQAQVDRAQADGRWQQAYAGQADAEVPADLMAAIAAAPLAEATFSGLSRANRYALIYRVNSAKRADTRQRRIADYIAQLERGETIHPQGRSTPP